VNTAHPVRASRRVAGLHSLRVLFMLSFSALLACAPGCATREEWDRFWDRLSGERRSQPDAAGRTPLRTKALEGTIGPLVTIEGLRLTSVRGYGLVVDLAGAGGRDGPEVVKKYLQKEIRRRQGIGEPGIPAEELFASRDVAMVEATGLIPAAAKKGDRFDVVVRALGTECRSLVGGRLVLCDLKLFADTPSGVIEGKTLATASGPIFVSIFDKEGKAISEVDVRQGFVLGGAMVQEPRRIRLVLNDPSYSVAQQIVARINGRYSPLESLAVGKSPSFVDLNIPDEYRARKRLFLERVMHTSLADNPALLERRADELVKEIQGAEPEYDSIGLAWEAIGKIILPKIKPLYQNKSAAIRYYAARTGLRMGDLDGMEAVAAAAMDATSRFRAQAIDELGFALNLYSAGEYLRQLLADPDESVRIRAYRALRRRPHKAIASKMLDKDNFVLDVLDCEGPYMVYVQRLGEPRIAVFGRRMACRGPVIFPPGTSRRDWRTQTLITAKAEDSDLTVVYNNKRTGRHSPPLSAPRNVGKLLAFLGDAPVEDDEGRMRGLAVPYSEIVDILHTFCDLGVIPARLAVERLDEGEEAGVEQPRRRPESEIEAGEAED